MSNALSVPNSQVPARVTGVTVEKAAKKAAKKGAKKAAGHPQPEKAGPDHEHKHDPQADLRRAYLHPARAHSLLAILPKGDASGELKKLYSLCKHLGESEGVPARAVAESARALEHLCFVGLAVAHSSSGNFVPKEVQRDFVRHFQHEYERQVEHFEQAEATDREEAGRSPGTALLDLARLSLATAEKMLRKKNWHLTHECLRVTDARTKGIEQL